MHYFVTGVVLAACVLSSVNALTCLRGHENRARAEHCTASTTECLTFRCEGAGRTYSSFERGCNYIGACKGYSSQCRRGARGTPNCDTCSGDLCNSVPGEDTRHLSGGGGGNKPQPNNNRGRKQTKAAQRPSSLSTAVLFVPLAVLLRLL